MEYKLQNSFMMVTTGNPRGSDSGPFKDNDIIYVVSLNLSEPYKEGEASCGRWRWKKVYATTDKGIEFLLHDDENDIHNARQYGNGSDPRHWGHNLPGYTLK